MEAKGIGIARVRKAALALFAMLLLAVAMAPAGAQAAKVNNPSPPNFKAEVTGGFLQFIGSTGTPLQLPLDFSTLDPPLPNPTLTGTVTTNAQRYGVINIPQAGIVFPPIPVDVADFSLTIRMLPVNAGTGFIDPLTGRVDLNIPIRLKAEGSALGQNLGDNCYIGSAGNPINISTTTHNGTFPTTNPPPAQSTYVADFVSDGGSFAGGWFAAQPYTEDSGTWPFEPKPVPGKPVGTLPKPTPSEIPYNDLTDFVPRSAGSWRGMNETLAAPAAAGCGTGILAGTVNDQVNSNIGLPSASGASTASLDFRFVSFADRTGDNAVVQKGVKSIFTAPGISSSPWPTTQVPTAVSAQSVSIDASTSRFKVGGHPSERYAFDFGTGTFGAWTTNPVGTFIAPTLGEGAPPVILPIRVKVKDTDSDEDIGTRNLKVVPATDITLDTSVSSVAGSKLRAGSSGHVKFDVTNTSDTDTSSQAITFSATLPSGVSLTSLDSPVAWTCNTTSSTISCTIPQAGLATNELDHFDASVDVATSTANPAFIVASAVMAGDPAPANNTTNLGAQVVKTDLALDLTRTSSLVANGWTPYTIDVSNVGDGLTVGGSTVTVSLPPDFSYRSIGSGGTGWACSAPSDPREVVCTRASEIAGNASAPQLTVVAKIDRTAAAIDSTVSATVVTQGDVNAFSGSDTDSDTATVNVVPDLAVDTAISGNFVVGDAGTITFVATNQAVVPVNGPTTITSTLPNGLTVNSVSGPGWDCTATTPGSSDISCSYAAGLAGNENTSALTADVGVAQAAYPGVTVTSTVANVDDGFALNNSDSADVVVKRLDVSIQKLAVKPFNVGIDGRYRLNVTNVGDSPTIGATTVLDDLPAGLHLKSVSGAGWSCPDSQIGQQHVECVLNSLLGPGVQAAPIEVKVDVLDEAAEAGTVTNTAYADTLRDTRGVPADAAITDNNTSTVETTAVAVDLSIDSHHAGDFKVMTEDVYSLTVRNVGFFGTDDGEAVTVTDDLPDGILPLVDDIDISHPTGWTCDEDAGDVVCTLVAPSPTDSAMEPESSVTIDIPVVITDAAADDSNNIAEVSTARDANPILSPNNRFEDPTHVTRIDLELAAQQTIPSRAGGIGEINVDVDNIGTADTSAPSVVTIPLASGTSYRPTGSTVTGWSCTSPGAGTQVTCTRSPIIAAGGVAPPLKIRTNVSNTAPASWNTNVTLSTGGEAPERLANNSVTVPQTLEKIDLNITKSHDPSAVKAGKHANYKIDVANIGNTGSTGTIRVDDPVDSTFQNVTASGPGWSCSVTGNAVACTRTSSLGAGQSAPSITVGFDIPGDAAGTRDSIATVSNSSDPFSANDTDGDPISIVASADVEMSIDQPSTMKVGDTVNITYTVENVGTEDTTGSPSVKLTVGTSSGLDPISTSSPDGWDCSISSASGPDPAFLDCVLPDALEPGDSASVIGEFDVIPTPDTQTATLAVASTVGDVNPSNNFDSATSSLSGVDLQAAVAVPTGTGLNNGHEDLTAGETARRIFTVTNVGTSPTSSPVSVTVPLPDGVQWHAPELASGVGVGWTCSQPVRSIICNRPIDEQIAPNASAPVLNLDLQPSRSNAPSITVNYIVSTLGDEDAENDTATRVDNVLYYPDTTITSSPTGTTTSHSATIEFESDDETATFECKVDAGAFAACPSPLSLSDLGLGEHSVSVQAVNDHSMIDPTPDVATWTVAAQACTGPYKNIKANLTEGTLSLASLGEVPLPADQLVLDGKHFDNGCWQVPAAKVQFAPIEQVVDAPGLGSVTVKITLSATGDGSGTLPKGGGPGSFNLPVQAKLEASLGSIPVIGPEADCYLRPITFDLSGTYAADGKSVTVSSDTVGFPVVSEGCGALGTTVNTLIGLPRNDISISMTFGLVESDVIDPCPTGTHGTQPNCIPDVVDTPPAKLKMLKTLGKKKVKSGKKLTLIARVKNSGEGDASNAKVCLKSPKKLVKGKAKRCKTIKALVAGTTAKVKFTVKTKPGKAGKKIKFKLDTAYTPEAGAVKKHTKTGHVTLMK